MRFTDGRIYEGHFAMGEPQGWGQMRYPASAGEFKGDVMYEGHFEAGLFHGEGTLWERWPNGRGYSATGEEDEDRSPNNNGAATKSAGTAASAVGVAQGAFSHPPGVVTYRGPFVHGARHGKKGVEDYPGTGEQYVGSFVDNQQSGHGVLFYALEEPTEENDNTENGTRRKQGSGKKMIARPTPPLDRHLALKAIRAAHATAAALAQEVADAADPEAAVVRIAAEQAAELKASKEALRKQRIGGGGGIGRSRSESPDKKHHHQHHHSGSDTDINSPKGSPKKRQGTGSTKGSSNSISAATAVAPKPRVKKYEGEWLHGTFHGKGALWAANGAIFVGKFEKGLRQDENGVEVYADGSKYVLQCLFVRHTRATFRPFFWKRKECQEMAHPFVSFPLISYMCTPFL